MACLCRIRQTRVNHLISQLKRSYYHVSAPCLSNYIYHNNLPSNSIRQQIIGLLGSSNGLSVRYFAAPVQTKKKEEANKSKGPRLNEQIKSHMVRLVSDEGHEILPFHVALERAKSINCDLVEVNSNAKPIVCKIMDYHRDRYQQQLKEKERSKNKAESSVRKGSCKEVRISLKIEQKDLEMKADMAKRLMERGYRVKCMVQGPNTAEEDPKARAAMDQKLKGLIERLHALIEDVAFVESGPRVEKTQAFVLVRHIKFGPSKKGGKGAAKSANPPTSGSPKDASSSRASGPVPHPENTEFIMASEHSDLKNDDEESFSGEFDLGDDKKIAYGQEKETTSPVVTRAHQVSYSPSTSRVGNIVGPGANSSENRYSRQNVTRAEPEGCMRSVCDQAQMTQPPNFTGSSENRYSRHPPGPIQQQPPPHREIPKQNPTTSNGVPPSTSYGIFSSSSTSLPRSRPATNGIMKTQGLVSGEASKDSPLTENTNTFSGLFNKDCSKNPNASPFGFMKPHTRKAPSMQPPVSGSESPPTKNTNILSELLSGDGLKTGNTTSLFGSMKTQGRPSARPIPDSPIAENTMNPYSGLFSGDGSNVKASETFPTKPT